MSTRLAVDSLAMRDDRVFGWGWVLNDDSPARKIEIQVPLANGGRSRLVCLRGGSRPDLAEAFPHVPHALGGGFLIQGRIGGELAAAPSVAVITYEDGRVETREMPGFPQCHLASAVNPDVVKHRLSRLLDHARRNGIQFALSRSWNFLKKQARPLLGGRRRMAALAQAGTGVDHVLVFDHAMGGGANRFRDEWVARRVREGAVAYVVTPDLPTLSYRVSRIDGHGARDAIYGSLAEALAVLDGLPACHVVVNDLVSFDDPARVLAWARGRRRSGGRLTFYLHDYLAACPSWTLVGDTDRFCNLPTPDVCARCLATASVPFLTFYPEVSIGDWRATWSAFFTDCDELVAFSRASADLLLRAHPDLAPARLQVAPHRVDYLDDRRVAPRLESPLVVAIIGHISVHKGADVVRGAARHAEATGAPISFVVMGTLENGVPSATLQITGAYASDELPALLEQHGTGICLLPSVCPETFSYVTSEIIHFGLPLAVFDLGAPAERARTYALGKVLADMDPEAVVHDLLAFQRELLARKPEQDSIEAGVRQ